METSGPIVETVSRKRLVTAAEIARTDAAAAKENTLQDFWEYVESLEPRQWTEQEHVVYLYREDPKDSTYSTEPSYVDKFSGTIEIYPGGPSYQMDDRGIIEHAIKEKHGGKAFRLILKKGKQRIAIGKCVNGAPPKYPDANAQRFPLPNAPAPSSSDNVATRAMDLVANNNPQLMTVAMDAISRAADLVARHNPVPPPTATSLDADLDRELRRAMLKKFLDPPPDPFEQFLRFKQLMGDSGGGSSSMNSIVDKFLTVAAERVFNPVPATTGRTTLLDIGREFIPVLGTVMHEYRLSREADARITESQRSAMPAQSVPAVPQQHAPVTQLPVATQPAPQTAPNPPATPTMTFPQIEAHIASIIKNAEFTTDEAVDEVLAFLYNTDPRLVSVLLNPPSLDPRLKPGKEGLMMLCTYEAPFKECLSNVPRLSEFLDKFIVAATEEEANQARLRAAAPANAAPAPSPAPA